MEVGVSWVGGKMAVSCCKVQSAEGLKRSSKQSSNLMAGSMPTRQQDTPLPEYFFHAPEPNCPRDNGDSTCHRKFGRHLISLHCAITSDTVYVPTFSKLSLLTVSLSHYVFGAAW
jgi:hypothetical protein